MNKLSRFLRSMLKIGCIGFGGGTALIPVIERELIGDGKLDTKENYEKDILVANLTPGALPVELAASLGRRSFGCLGMLLGAVTMAAPGTVATLLLLTCLSKLRARIGILMEMLTIIISAFIIYLIICYIRKICIQCHDFSPKFFRRAIIVMGGVFLLSCGKNLHKLLGISRPPLFTLSTFRILVMAFTVILLINFVRGKRSLHTGSTSAPARTSHPAPDWKRLNTSIASNTAVWLSFLAVCSLPAVVLCLCRGCSPSFYLTYLGRGCLSALMSFGGGDAYLAVADGLFVEPSLIGAETFYGDIVSIANILPGSILCKALTAIGYNYGTAITNSIWGGLTFALGGFAASITVSGGIFTIIYHLYDSLSDLRSMQTVSHYIGPIICGLLGTVILALLVLCKNAAAALFGFA